jgi:hypothetical protein
VDLDLRGDERRDGGGLLRERAGGERGVRERERLDIDNRADHEPVHVRDADHGDGKRDVLYLGLRRP